MGKKYSLKEKIAYYTKRAGDKALSAGQREYAKAFLSGHSQAIPAPRMDKKGNPYVKPNGGKRDYDPRTVLRADQRQTLQKIGAYDFEGESYLDRVERFVDAHYETPCVFNGRLVKRNGSDGRLYVVPRDYQGDASSFTGDAAHWQTMFEKHGEKHNGKNAVFVGYSATGKPIFD